MGEWEITKRNLKKNSKSSEKKTEDLGVTVVLLSIPVDGSDSGRGTRAWEQLTIQMTMTRAIQGYGL